MFSEGSKGAPPHAPDWPGGREEEEEEELVEVDFALEGVLTGSLVCLSSGGSAGDSLGASCSSAFSTEGSYVSSL